jgi:hypothetical protein
VENEFFFCTPHHRYCCIFCGSLLNGFRPRPLRISKKTASPPTASRSKNDSTYTARLFRKEILPAKKKPFKSDDYFLNLPRNLISSYSPKNVFHLKNAPKNLPHYYGQRFRASESKSECHSGITRKEREYNVLLVGPCVKSMPVAHYCLIEGKHPALYRTELFENVPEISLFDGTGTDLNSLTCSGTAQKEHQPNGILQKLEI